MRSYQCRVPRTALFGARLRLPNNSFLHLGEYEVVAEEGDRLVVEVRLRTPEAVAFAEGTGDPLMAKWLELSCPAYLERWVRDNGARWPMKQ